MVATTYDRAAAVKFAKAQLGKPYVFAGTGNPGFDCSGLVMCSVAAGGGPQLPHNSGAQVSARGVRALPLTAANKAALLPGDIVFWYGILSQPTTISHCGFYVGRSDPPSGSWLCVAAVDEAHGVMKHRMNWALPPSGFGFIAH